MNHLFLFCEERNTTKNIKSSSAPSFHRFVIYKRTQYTHLQNGPFDAIRFSWQANYRKQGFLQTVRVFDLRVMELRVELRLSFFLFYTVRSLLWARLRESRWWHPLDVFILILTSLVLFSSSSSKQQQFGQQDGRPSVQLVGKALQGGRHCGHHRRVVRIGTFLFSLLFWSCFKKGGFKQRG